MVIKERLSIQDKKSMMQWFNIFFNAGSHKQFRQKSLLFLMILSFSNACQSKFENNNTPCFYHWKTSYHLTDFEKKYVHEHQVKKIYLHCFDIAMHDSLPKPQGVLLWDDSVEKKIEYIPTVFIDNEVFKHLDSLAIQQMAKNTLSLCKQILDAQQLNISEIQIDCDWTKSTRTNYFYFLNQLKKQPITLSATLRLYQYKYQTESGIPPVDYVSLMCYNMGTLKNVSADNSILNTKDLSAYLNVKTPYPIALNVALPIFNWTLLYHAKQFKGILYLQPNVMNENWHRQSSILYICNKEYYDTLCDRIFYPNESVRIETITKKQLHEAQQTIQQNITNTKNEIIYFDLDSNKISQCLY